MQEDGVVLEAACRLDEQVGHVASVQLTFRCRNLVPLVVAAMGG